MPKRVLRFSQRYGKIFKKGEKNSMNKSSFKNLIRGMGSILNICPNTNYRKIINNSRRTDAEALRQDWNKVGKDLKSAIEKADYGKKSR